MVAVVEKIPPDLSTSKLDGIQRRLAELFEERPNGPFHFPDVLEVTGRSPKSHGVSVKLAMVIGATLDRHGIDRGLMSGRGSSFPKEVVIEIAEAIGEPNPRNQELGRRRAEKLHQKTAELPLSGVVNVNRVNGHHPTDGVIFDGKPTASTVREGKPAMRRVPPFIKPRSKPTNDGVASAKPVETAELKNVGPYTLAPIEVYVLAFGLCMINRLFSSEEDGGELKRLGLRLTQGELVIVHKFIEHKPKQFDLAAVIAQIHDKVVNLTDKTKREDVLRQNNPEVERWLVRRFADFRDQKSLDEALEFMFRPLRN